MSDLVERRITVNGEPCRVWEKGQGKPLFYLAGILGLPRWTRFLDLLAERRRVLAPSLPGFPGGSGHGQLDAMIDWVAATLDLVEGAGMVPGSDLIGSSVGGALAAEVAAMAPGLVRRLVLIAPFGLYDPQSPPTDVWAQKPGTGTRLFSADAAALADYLACPAGEDPAEWAIAMTRASEAAARLLWPLGDTRLERRLHRVTCETLLLWGDADQVLAPHYAPRFAAGIGGRTRIAVIPRAGHLAELDAPGPLAEQVLAALA